MHTHARAHAWTVGLVQQQRGSWTLAVTKEKQTSSVTHAEQALCLGAVSWAPSAFCSETATVSCLGWT